MHAVQALLTEARCDSKRATERAPLPDAAALVLRAGEFMVAQWAVDAIVLVDPPLLSMAGAVRIGAFCVLLSMVAYCTMYANSLRACHGTPGTRNMHGTYCVP